MPTLRASTHLVALLGLTTVLVGPAARPARATDGAQTQDDTPEPPARALVRVKILRSGAVLELPSHVAELGKENRLLVSAGEQSHEVALTLQPKGADAGYDLKLAYRANGKPILQGATEAAPKAWAKVRSKDGKTEVQLLVDPEAQHAGHIEVKPTDDPLGGLE